MFFSSVFTALLEPSANTPPVWLKDIPVLVVMMAFFITWVACWLPLAAILAIAIKWRPNKPLQPQQKLLLIVPLYLLAPPLLWGVSYIINTPFSNYGFPINISILGSWVLGFGLGVFSLSFVFIWQFWQGWSSWQNSHIQLVPSVLLQILLIALFVGGIEELVFRGFLFTELEQDYPTWVAAVISSLIFALLHLVWERRETIPQLPGLWLMGMVLVLARFVDGGDLGLAWGLHTAWVWGIATIDTTEIITYSRKVSEWFTGKNNKPLAGVAGIVCVLGTGVMLWLFSLYFSSNS